MYVDQNGVQLWEIGRMPAATATNGAANVAGINRLLESVPEPIRDGRPLFTTIRAISDPEHLRLRACQSRRAKLPA
jgi:hypothetical protein